MLWPLMEALHFITPFIVVGLTLMVSIGFSRLLLVSEGVVRSLAFGFLLLYFMVLCRTVYWDILSVYLPDDIWRSWLALTHGITFNVIFHLMVIAASYYSLKAIHQSIPAEVRKQYSILTAFLYPRCPTRIRDILGFRR